MSSGFNSKWEGFLFDAYSDTVHWPFKTTFYSEMCFFVCVCVAFHTFLMSRATNDLALLVYRLFAFSLCWLAACLWFAQRLSEAPPNWYNGKKSGDGNFYKQQTAENQTVSLAFPEGSWSVHLQLGGLPVDCRFKFAASVHKRHQCSPLFSVIRDTSKSFQGFRGRI